MKPYMGKIDDWEEVIHSEWAVDDVKGTLGYKIKGLPKGHPKFDGWIVTSLVVKREGDQIETMNSRYDLGSPKSSALSR